MILGTPDSVSAGLIDVINSTHRGSQIAADAGAGASHNSAGLGAPFPAFPTTHSAQNTSGFLTASSPTASLHYDFGSQQNLNLIRVWNYHGGGAIGSSARSVRLFGSNTTLAFSDENDPSWVLLDTFTLTQAPADGDTTPYGQQINVADASIRYVRLQIDSNYGAPTVGLAEVQFLEAVPEPSPFVLLVVGLTGALIGRKRQVRVCRALVCA